MTIQSPIHSEKELYVVALKILALAGEACENSRVRLIDDLITSVEKESNQNAALKLAISILLDGSCPKSKLTNSTLSDFIGIDGHEADIEDEEALEKDIASGHIAYGNPCMTLALEKVLSLLEKLPKNDVEGLEFVLGQIYRYINQWIPPQNSGWPLRSGLCVGKSILSLLQGNLHNSED